MCCEDWDTDCEPEYPCEAVINHCATCPNPWDITCESDSSDDRDDDAKVDTLANCLPCESAGCQMHVRECKCEATTRYDQTIKDIRDALDSNFDEIDPRNSENIRRYQQDIINQCNKRHAPIDDSGTVRDDYSEVCAVNEEQLTPQDDDDSLAIEIFLEEISEDIDLTRTVSGQQLDIPGWLHPNTTVDKESSDTHGVVQTARPTTTRANQSRGANGSLGSPKANLDHTQENGRRDMPQDDGLKDKQEDLACAIDAGDKQSDGGDFAEANAPGRSGSTPSVKSAKDKVTPQNPAQMDEGRSEIPQPNRYDRVIIEWCCGRDSMLGKTSKRSGGCKVVRLTIDDDLRALEGLRKAIRVVQNCPRGWTLLWISMPCAGGSLWQTLNVAMAEDLGKIEGR
jgi:hypothetical protein